MIKLIDLISSAGVKLYDYKIHCATGKNPTPLEAFFDGNFKEWQEHQTKMNFQCKHVLSMIHLANDRWLFTGVYAVKGVKPFRWKGKNHFRYATQEIKGLEHLAGKAVVQFEKKFRASYLRGTKFEDKLLLKELRDQRMTIGDFPGYNSVLLSYRMLNTVIRESNPSWKSALSSVSGVYLITDTSDGRQYVGSAYGGEGIWQRWNSYIKNGHGGNKELRFLLRQKKDEHAENFQFSLLEVCDLNSSDDYIISREAHWKNVLRSREFGLNKN